MKTRILIAATILISCIGCTSGPYVSTNSSPVAVSARPVTTTTLVATDEDRIRAFLRSESANNGRGRGRNGGLPPGIARNLERGKPLPPGIAKTYLPVELSRTLPPLDSTLEYVVIAGKLLVVEIATQIVRDVLIDVMFD